MKPGWMTLALASVVMSMACDPCSGVVACSGDPRVSLTGRILDESSGRGVSGVVIDVVRVGGTELERDSVRVRTDDEGLFGVDLGATSTGEVLVDIAVAHASGAYRVRNLSLTPTTRRGEGKVLRPWSTQPRLPDLGVTFRRGFPSYALSGVQVEFRRTGGTELIGLDNGIYRTTTGSDGWFELFGARVTPTDADDVIGDLVIHAPDPIGTYVHRNVRITPSVTFREAPRLRTFGVGPNIEYHFEAMYRGRFGVVVPGVRVEFTRTAGIRVTEESWSATTDAFGRVAFHGFALDTGTLQGTLRIIPPAPAKTYERPIELRTYDADGARFWGILGIGPGLPYYLILRRNGIPVAGVGVEMIRTGGIAIHPDRINAVSNDSGMVVLTPEPKSEGELLADIVVRPPAPFASFTVPVRMMALDADVPGGRVLLGDWEVTAPPSSIRRDR